jgi:hypothetical protein
LDLRVERFEEQEEPRFVEPDLVADRRIESDNILTSFRGFPSLPSTALVR